MKKIVFLLTIFISSLCFANQNVVVVFDDSGSMSEALGNISKIDAAKQGMLKVLSTLPPDSKLGIVCLNHNESGNHWVLPLGDLNQSKLNEAIGKLNADGGTPLGAYIKIGADALLALRAKEHYGTYRIVIATDGEADDPTLVQSYTNDLLSKGITLDVIGVNMATEHQLAKQAGKRYRNVINPDQLNQALQTALAESKYAAGNDDEDFKILAGLDGDAAKAMIGAVTQLSNDPIVVPGPRPQIDGHEAPEPGSPVALAANSAQTHEGAFGIYLFGGIVVFIIIFFVFAILVKAFNS